MEATILAPMGGLAIGPIDVAVLVAFLASAPLVGALARRRARSLDAYLLGDRDLPWWVILGSIVATETSAATVLSVPGEGAGEAGLRFLQLPIGYLLGRIVIARWLLPLYLDGKVDTAHEILETRFGPAVRRAAAALFLVCRTLGDGLRLYLAGIVVERITGLPPAAAVAVTAAVTILSTVTGGFRAVAWNDCVQLVTYVVGGAVAAGVILARIPGGLPAAWGWGLAEGKLRVLDWSPDPGDPWTAWAGLCGGVVLALGTHGTDHMMVQRYLAARSPRDAARALVGSGVVVFGQFALFLSIGILLGAFHALGGAPRPAASDELFVGFIVDHFPRDSGLVGLLLAAILAAAMSTVSSSLNASASSFLHDWWIPFRGRADEAALVRASRRVTLLFGLLQLGVAIAAPAWGGTVIRTALSIAGYSAGTLLGVFALGCGRHPPGERATILAGAAGIATLLTVQFVLPARGIVIAFPYFALVNAATTYAVGRLLALLADGGGAAPRSPSGTHR